MSSIEFTPFINEAVFLFPESGKREAEFPSFKALKRMKRELCLRDHLRLAFVWDDKDEFINAFKGVPPDEDLPVSLFGFMYAYDAVNCASELIYHNHNHAHFPFNIFDTAVGKVKYRDREPYVVSTVSTPLHTAAVSQSINLIRLFLDAGLSPNVRIDYIDTWNIRSNATDILPLDLAIRHFWERYGMEEWAKTKPIFELIVNVCSPWMAKQIEIVRLLARKTSDLDQQFFKYMEDGKVAEMCLLLLAGCKPPSTDLLEYRDDIPEKEKILELFEVFNTIGDKLSGYIRIPRSKYAMLDRVTSEITAIFEDSGLVVKCKDIPYKRPVEYDVLPVPDSKKIIIPRLLSPPALRGLSFTNKESPSVLGVRGFHKSSFPEAGRNLSRVHVKNNKVTGDLRFQLYKHRAFFTTALTRMGRLV